jgi:fumarate reductase flavoprotein subunit
MYNTTFTGNAISFQKDKTGFVIFDNTIKNHMETVGFDHASLVFPILKAENIDGLMQAAADAKIDCVYSADSLDELAEKTGIDPEGLKKTVEEYNRYCSQGYDEEFHKDRRLLKPLTEPKYYAAKNNCSGYGTLGGIKINHKAEVLDKNWNKIPGLYAGGTDANSIYGDSYPFILPGNTMGFAINSGRIAGENAAEYAKS